MAKNILVGIMTLISVIYIVNPTAGILELIPDNMPFIGNLDEAAATALLLTCLRYYGFDITRFFSKNKDNKKLK